MIIHKHCKSASPWRRVSALAGALAVVAAPASATTLHVSQFVFHDADGDGLYERTDKPFVGADITMRSGVDIVTATSNLNGFANWNFGLDDPDADFAGPGSGEVWFRVPDGMFISTDATSRDVELREVPDSISGLVIDPPLPFLGLAVLPRITVATPAPIAAADVLCVSENLSVAAEANALGQPVCAVPPEHAEESWRVLQAGDGGPVELAALVPGYRNTVILAGDGRGVAAAGALHTESFDTLIHANDIREWPVNGDGMVFHNLIGVHRLFYGGPGYINGVTSGEFGAYNSSGHPATLSRAGGFEPVSAELTYAWEEAASGVAELEFWRDGALAGTVPVALSHDYPTHLLFGWGSVDKLVLKHSTYWQIVVDDLSYRLPGGE